MTSTIDTIIALAQNHNGRASLSYKSLGRDSQSDHFHTGVEDWTKIRRTMVWAENHRHEGSTLTLEYRDDNGQGRVIIARIEDGQWVLIKDPVRINWDPLAQAWV